MRLLLLVAQLCLQGFSNGFLQGERLASRECRSPHLLAQGRSCGGLIGSGGLTLGREVWRLNVKRRVAVAPKRRAARIP